MSNKKQKSPEPETSVDVTTDRDFKGLIVVALMNFAALNVTLPPDCFSDCLVIT